MGGFDLRPRQIQDYAHCTCGSRHQAKSSKWCPYCIARLEATILGTALSPPHDASVADDQLDRSVDRSGQRRSFDLFTHERTRERAPDAAARRTTAGRRGCGDPGHGLRERGRDQAGGMFGFSRKRLSGSYRALIRRNRSMFTPYAVAVSDPAASSACPVKLVYVVPVE